MVVNSFIFLAFFVVVFVVYYAPWTSRSITRQNVWLLLTSYFFYGYVDWKTLPLLFCVTLIFFLLGRTIRNAIDKGNTTFSSKMTTVGVILGVGILLYFKYLNFFADSVALFLQSIGIVVSWSSLNIVLPIGVSFFTFKLVSYVIEVHREKISPSKGFLEFAVYISFFPTIMSGPIDRPGAFLPQIRTQHRFDFNLAMEGCQQILWGIFTKMVIADRLAAVTTTAWENPQGQIPFRLIYAAVLSPIQIYADFDGYSNMAIGIGKILGFKITKNFNHPLLARNVADYWRRWHISLTAWITDYVFMPLNIAFRNMGKMGIMLAVTINLVTIGMWHGANWKYALFGLYYSLLYIPLILSDDFGKNKKLKEGRWGLPKAVDFLKMISTYVLVAFGQILFFSPNLSSFGLYVARMFSWQDGFVSPFAGAGTIVWFWMALIIVLEWITRKREFPIQRMSGDYSYHHIRLIVFDLFLAVMITMFGGYGRPGFIYFQF